MGLDHNLALAKQAIMFVASKMSLGASNQYDHYRVWALDDRTLFTLKNQCLGTIRSQQRSGPWGDVITQAAALAMQYGCGNCGEQAAIAFKFLESLQVRPLDFCQRTSDWHQFVAIGRQKGSDVGDTSTWGPDAVICDAWDRMQAYPASQIQVKMFGTHKKVPESLYRVE